MRLGRVSFYVFFLIKWEELYSDPGIKIFSPEWLSSHSYLKDEINSGYMTQFTMQPNKTYQYVTCSGIYNKSDLLRGLRNSLGNTRVHIAFVDHLGDELCILLLASRSEAEIFSNRLLAD